MQIQADEEATVGPWIMPICGGGEAMFDLIFLSFFLDIVEFLYSLERKNILNFP